MNRRTQIVLLAVVVPILAIAGAIYLGTQLADDDEGSSASDSTSAEASPSPSFVEPAECREEGTALLEDAEAVLTAETADELARHATIVQGDHFPSCAGEPVNALAHVVDAVNKVSQEAEICRLTGQWMDYDGDGQQEDLTGFECQSVNRAFSKVNRTIDEARAVLDAKS